MCLYCDEYYVKWGNAYRTEDGSVPVLTVDRPTYHCVTGRCRPESSTMSCSRGSLLWRVMVVSLMLSEKCLSCQGWEYTYFSCWQNSTNWLQFYVCIFTGSECTAFNGTFLFLGHKNNSIPWLHGLIKV